MNETIDIDFLMKFCDYRFPWVENGKTYATDSKIAIELFSDFGIEPGSKRPPDIARIFPADLESLPEIPFGQEPVGTLGDCQECEKGFLLDDCEDCDGDGAHECSCGDTHRCRTCNGEGSSPGTTKCEECNGTGKVTNLEFPVDFGHFELKAKYVCLLMKLPGHSGIKYHPTLKNVPVFVLFDGGRAVVMPITK